jgi:hypothetical protein
LMKIDPNPWILISSLSSLLSCSSINIYYDHHHHPSHPHHPSPPQDDNYEDDMDMMMMNMIEQIINYAVALGNWLSENYRNLSEFWRQTAAQLFYDRFRGVFGAYVAPLRPFQRCFGS